MWTLKITCMLFILTITIIAGYYPFYQKIKTKDKLSFPIGEALAAGVFLGAGLIHMLGDAAHEFYRLGYDYPIPFLITGMVFLGFLLLEHIGKELYQHQGSDSSAFAILAMVMLSIHSYFTGAALGLGDSTSMVIMILLAIAAHKWAESFALATQINKSPLPLMTGLALYAIFSLMVPAGILSGTMITHALDHYALVTPIFSAVAAGTFLYLGTLHGLEQATLIKQCCNLHRYYFVMLGFALMAVVAIWT